MENNQNSPSTPQKETNYQVYQQKKPVFLIILTILLTIAIGILGWVYYEQMQEAKIANSLLEEEKSDLTNQLSKMYTDYDALKTENDSINSKLEEQQAKIKRLLTINASNAEKIRLYKNELMTLREVMKSYIVQIDSLNQANQALRTENVQVKEQLYVTETEKQELSKVKEELSSKVQLASVLSAKNVLALPLNDRSREKYKASKVTKIKTCFTIRENPIVEAGNKMVYIRILRPDNAVLSSSGQVFGYKNETLAYTAKREVMYENKDVELCIFWDKTEELLPGTYTVDIYSENNLIGTTTFVLE